MSNPKMAHLDVAAGIIWRDGAFLAARRPAGKPFAGLWEFPGGKIEPDETPEAALARELAEELGLDAGKMDLFSIEEHFYEAQQLYVKLFFFQIWQYEGDPVPEEGQEIRWLTPLEAQNCQFLPADEIVLRKLAGHSQ